MRHALLVSGFLEIKESILELFLKTYKKRMRNSVTKTVKIQIKIQILRIRFLRQSGSITMKKIGGCNWIF
jgi:hypothetical protein